MEKLGKINICMRIFSYKIEFENTAALSASNPGALKLSKIRKNIYCFYKYCFEATHSRKFFTVYFFFFFMKSEYFANRCRGKKKLNGRF